MAYELIRVSELAELSTPADANVLPIQAGDTLKKITFANLKGAAVGDMEGSLAAAYDSTATYAVGDYCVYEGRLYRCTTAITTAEAWTAGHWTAAVLTDDIESELSTEASTRSTNDNALAADIAKALGDLAAVYSTSATYAVGDYCIYQGQLYRCTTAITTAEAWTSGHWSAVALGNDTRDLRSALNAETEAREAADEALEESVTEILTDYAQKDGTYEDLTSGNAEVLLSDVYTENSEPYLFRKTGGSDKVGSREYLDKIVGGSLAVNQLCNSASVTVTNGHKYYMKKSGTASIGASTGSAITGLTSGTDMVIDLTSEFGATIADYVYSLETATAGAGVAWLRQYIDIDSYHPYSEPTLKHVEGLQSHDAVGFNAWDEEWEPGGFYTSTGLPWTTDTRIRSKNFIPVLPNTRYHILIPYGENTVVLYYDSSKQFISTSSVGNGSIFTTPINARYIMFNTGANYVTKHGLNYNHDICINFSSAITNGTYEPYQKRSYPLDSSVVLRGYPMLVDGRLKFDGDEYLPDGTINRNYVGLVLDGSADEAWSLQSINAAGIANFYITIPDYSVPITVICNNADFPLQNTTIADTTSQGFLLSGSHTLYIRILSTTASSVEALKTWLASNNLEFVYKAASSTTETAEPFRQLQICDTYGTEEFVTTSEIPVGTETRYPEDLKSKIEGLPWDLSMIAPIEDGTTASQAYTTGQYFMHNNIFCKALANIASGATFTLNTNYSETTIAAELYTALH